MESNTRIYKSKLLQDFYNRLMSFFKEEGDCYESILKSIEEDYESPHLPIQHVSKILIKEVLLDVTVDYYKNKNAVNILSEEEYLNLN